MTIKDDEVQDQDFFHTVEVLVRRFRRGQNADNSHKIDQLHHCRQSVTSILSIRSGRSVTSRVWYLE
ncbi:hypothetical protein VTN96DRAFT_2019 [Rasamsonia emersonii]